MLYNSSWFYMGISEGVEDDMVWQMDFMSVYFMIVTHE